MDDYGAICVVGLGGYPVVDILTFGWINMCNYGATWVTHGLGAGSHGCYEQGFPLEARR